MVVVKVDKKKCLGCGLCASIAPDVFELGPDGKARVKNPNACGEECQEAANSCPANAISISKK